MTEQSALSTSAPSQERAGFPPAPARHRYASYLSDSARWDDFGFRHDDIVICTPAKCGTTWMQMICALLIFQSNALPGRLDKLSPWLDSKSESLGRVVAALAAQKHRRFIKTHTPLDGLPFDERVTYLCVGQAIPRDVAVSFLQPSPEREPSPPCWQPSRPPVVSKTSPSTGPGAPRAGPTTRGRVSGPGSRRDLPLNASTRLVRVRSGGGSSLVALLGHLGTFWERRHLANVVLFHYSGPAGRPRATDAPCGHGAGHRRRKGPLARAGDRGQVREHEGPSRRTCPRDPRRGRLDRYGTILQQGIERPVAPDPVHGRGPAPLPSAGERAGQPRASRLGSRRFPRLGSS